MEQPHPVIQPFLDYLKFEKRYSQHTSISYQTDLTAFFDYLQTAFGGCALTEVTHSYVRSWLAAQKQEGMSGKSLNRKISTLKSFFKYCVKTGAVAQTPMAKIISPKNEKRLPLFVAEKDVDTLLNNVAFADDWEGKTDRLVLQLFYATGIRLSELIGLKIGALNFSSSSIKVLGKGNKERILPVTSRLMGEVQQYQTERKRLHPDCTVEQLLITNKGAALAKGERSVVIGRDGRL
ncbi:MAG: site-specific integrase, partial [Bacteroidota bacterium]